MNLRVEEQKREVEQRGADPEDPNQLMAMVAESFREAMKVLTEALPEEELEPEPEEEESSELYEAGLRYCRAVESLGSEDGLMSEARLISMILMAKTARLIGQLPLRRDALCREDTVLTLLLIDQLERQAAALVMAAAAEWNMGRMFGFRRARRDLRRELDVHLEGIKRSEREFVERLVVLGRAPSPFCIAMGPPMRAA